MRMFLFQIDVDFSTPLRISLSPVRSDTKVCSIHSEGLASCPVDGYVIFRNGTKILVNSSEHDMFDYADSCKYLSY